jgi:hypothetical protein
MTNGLDLTSTFFIRNGLDSTSTFFIRNGLNSTITVVLHCSFQIGLDSSDFSFMFSGARNPRRHEVHAAAQPFKKNYELPYIVLVSEPEHKAKLSGSSRTNLMEFVKPAVSCPIECIRLLVCVRISCGFWRAACPRAPASRLSARSGVRIARALWEQACPLASCKQFSRELLQADYSCLALRRRPPAAAAATVRGTVACSDSSGPGGLQR